MHANRRPGCLTARTVDASVAPDLPADRGRSAAQHRCDQADRMPGNQRPRYVFALDQAMRPRGSSTDRRPDSASLGENPSHGRVMPNEQPRNLVQRLALPAAFPHQGLVAVRVLNPCPSLHTQHSCCLGSRLCFIEHMKPPPKADTTGDDSAISSAIRVIHRRLLLLGRKPVATPPRGGQLAAAITSTWSRA